MNARIAMVTVSIVAALIWCNATIPRGLNNAATAESSTATIDAARYATLQAAIDALPPGGGLVRLPAGVFEITQPLVIGVDDVCIEGSGTATHITNVNRDGRPALILRHPEESDDRQHELWRIRLANFRITGNETSGHGIEARRVNELFVDGVTVSYHGGDGEQHFQQLHR
jgi:hypothetical protein